MTLTKLIKSVSILLIITLFLALSISAHKDGSESSTSTDSYKISMSMIPAQIVEGQDQIILLAIIDTENDLPVKNLDVRVMIHDSTDRMIDNIIAGEELPGRYTVTNNFIKRGNYDVMAQVMKDDIMITQINRNIHVEPNGPSIYFWFYMLMALLLGTHVALKSHELK